MKEHSLVFQNELSNIAERIEIYNEELDLLDKLLQLIDETSNTWQHSESSHNLLWRNQLIDLLQEESFLLYLEAILHAQNILANEMFANNVETAKQFLTVLERDTLEELRSGNYEAHLRIENPMAFFRLGHAFSEYLQSIDNSNSDQWDMLVNKITKFQTHNDKLHDAQLFKDMPQRIKDTKMLMSITRNLQSMTAEIYESEQKSKQIKEEIRFHQSQFSELESQKTNKTDLLQKYSEVLAQLPALIEVIDEIYKESQVVHKRVFDLENKDELEDLENRIVYGKQLLMGAHQIIDHPREYIQIEHKTAFVDTSRAHEGIRELLEGRSIPIKDISIDLFENIAKAMQNKLYEIEKMIGTKWSNEIRVKAIKNEWWAKTIKPLFHPKDDKRPNGDKYFEDPKQAWEIIRSKLQTTSWDADHLDALKAMQSFFDEEVMKRLEYLAAEKLKAKLEAHFQRWQEIQTGNLDKLQSLQQDIEASKVELKIRSGELTTNYHHHLHNIGTLLSEVGR